MPEPSPTISNRYARHVPMLADGVVVDLGEWMDALVYERAHFQLTGAALAGADQIDIQGSNEATRPTDVTNDTVIHNFLAGVDGHWALDQIPRWIKAHRINAGGGASAGVSVVMRRKGGAR